MFFWFKNLIIVIKKLNLISDGKFNLKSDKKFNLISDKKLNLNNLTINRFKNVWTLYVVIYLIIKFKLICVNK